MGDTIPNEHIRMRARVEQASMITTQNDSSHVMRMKKEDIVRRMLDVDITGERKKKRAAKPEVEYV